MSPDKELLLSLNALVGGNDLYDKILIGINDNPLFRGFPTFVVLVALWFSSDCTNRRGRMLAGLLATCVATVLSVWLQFHVTPHIRPILDPSLHLYLADPKWIGFFDRKGSFPSDTAVLYFSLAAVIFLENRLAGCLCFLWTLIVVGLVRVAFGWHYPSDIAGSLVLGPGCVFLFSNIPYLVTLCERALNLFKSRMYIVHALLFVFLADAYNLFQGLERVSRMLWAITAAVFSLRT